MCWNCPPFSPTYVASHLPMVPRHTTYSDPSATPARDEEGKNTGGGGHKGVWRDFFPPRMSCRWLLRLDLSMRHKGIRPGLTQLLRKTQLIKEKKKCVQHRNKQTLMLGYLTHHQPTSKPSGCWPAWSYSFSWPGVCVLSQLHVWESRETSALIFTACLHKPI